MKKIYTLIFAALIFSLNAIAQNPTFAWAKRIGGPSSDWAQGVAVDATNNVYSTGYFTGTVDFDPGPGTFTMAAVGLQDIFISKLDASGNFVWAKRFGGGAGGGGGEAVAIDVSGNVYSTGWFTGTGDFDPGVGTFNLISGGSIDIFVSKLDASGNFVWAKRVGGGNQDGGYALTLDASGNSYITGGYSGTVDFDPGAGTFTLTTVSSYGGIFVLKLDASGNFVLAKGMGGNVSSLGELGQEISLDGSGNILTTGYFDGTADFDPGAGTFNLVSTSAQSDIFISKLDISGNFIWAKKIGGTGDDYGNGIVVDNLNNVYTTGYFNNAADFDPGAGTFTMSPGNGTKNIYISKLDASGNFVWAKQLTSSVFGEAFSITLDGLGNVYTTGPFAGTTDFDPGPGTFTLGSTNGAFISVLDASGNFVWAGQMNCSSSMYAKDIVTDANGYIYSVGTFAGTTDFDPGVGIFNLSSAGNFDSYIHKMAPCALAPTAPGAIGGPTSMCVGGGATSYSIAPVGSATSYTWSLPGGWSGSSATNTISATPGTTGIFSVTASNACGTSPQQTLNVTVNPLPTITVNSGSICSGQSFTMVPSGANTYTFQGGSAVVSPTTTTSYTVTGTSTAGCVSAGPATSNLTVNAQPTITVNSGSICSGQSFTMVPSGANTYTIQGGSAVVSPTANASYTVTGTSTAGCVSAGPATSNLTVNALPVIAVNSGSICAGNSFTISPSGANTYTIQGGSAIVSPTSTTSYTVAGTSTAGCVSASPATSNLTVNPLPTISASTSNTLICVGQSATLTASGASTYTFNPGGAGTSIVVSPTVTANYTITGTSAQGCNNSSVFTQSVSTCAGLSSVALAKEEIIIYPNPTTGDIFIKGVNENTKIEVYNLLGEKVAFTQFILSGVEGGVRLLQPSGIYFIRIGSTTRKIIKQ